MVTLFGTLGFHPEKLLAAIPGSADRIDKVVVYTGRAAKSQDRKLSEAAQSRVRDALEAMNVPYEHKEFASPWDFVEILQTLLEDLRGERREDVIFNLTGGPKTMTVAATIACLIHGVRVLYVPEEIEGWTPPIELPMLRIRYSQILTRKQQRVLRAVRDHSPRSLDELARILRVSNPTVTFHVQRLEKIGALAYLSTSKNQLLRAPRVTQAGEIMLLAEELLAETESKP